MSASSQVSQPPQRSRTRTGIPGLDDILTGGLPEGHLYLVEGDPGTGKTTLGLQFLLSGAAMGEKGLYVTLSESKEELEKVAASHGFSIADVPIYEMTPAEEELAPEAQYTVFHPSEIELADTLTGVLKHVEQVNPKRVVFDSLSELRMLARDPLRYRRQILALKKFFSGRGTTVMLLDDRTADENDLQLQSIAHGVIMMYSLERDYGIKRRRLEVRKLRGSRFREGYHDYIIKRGGIEVFPRLIAAEHKPGFTEFQLKSGIAELDTMLGGGIDAGTSTILLGPAGSGKSTIAICYAVAAVKRGDFAAILTFDETLNTMLRRMKGLNIDLERYVEQGKLVVEQIDPAEMSPGELVAHLRDLAGAHGAKVIVLDSLNGFMSAMPGEKSLVLQMHELLSFLNQLGVATIMTMAQHGMLGHMQTPIDISYLADSVLLLRFFESEGTIHKAISVVKKRSGRHETSLRELKLTEGRIAIGKPLDEFEGVLTGAPRKRQAN
jgi:circadian clock protein KaiC